MGDSFSEMASAWGAMLISLFRLSFFALSAFLSAVHRRVLARRARF